MLEALSKSPRLLLIQDLDGVCMGLVRDPLTRTLSPEYIRAAARLGHAFRVLTNGEHLGRRGVNAIVDRSLAAVSVGDQNHALYLPGLAGGGVQAQDCRGQAVHPGVSQQELSFLRSVVEQCSAFLGQLSAELGVSTDPVTHAELAATAVLDNLVSPTINLNPYFDFLGNRCEIYRQLQEHTCQFMESLMLKAAGYPELSDSFFIHYAPNLGRDRSGKERVRLSDGTDAGTTDFQFMLGGAVKEVGVLVILNDYYFQQTGKYPLGASFNARNAPRGRAELLQLAGQKLDPALMPQIVGIGDTVTSQSDNENGEGSLQRGGSDRGFLTLIQDIGMQFEVDNAVLFVDSSRGEVRRPGLDMNLLKSADAERAWSGLRGISDKQDDLRLNFVFPDGHEQYVEFFCKLSAARDSFKYESN